MADIRNITRAVQQLTIQKQIEDESRKALESRGVSLCAEQEVGARSNAWANYREQ
jgi:hypothetical protein